MAKLGPDNNSTAYIYIHIHIHIHAHIHTYKRTYVHTHIYIYIYMAEYLSIYLSIYLCVYIYMLAHYPPLPQNRVGPLSTWEAAHYPRAFGAANIGFWGPLFVSEVTSASSGIMCVSVVVFLKKRVGCLAASFWQCGGIWFLEVEHSCRGAGNKTL